MVSKLFYVGKGNSSFVLHVTQLGLFGCTKDETYCLLWIEENTDGLHDSHNQFRGTCEHTKLRDVGFVQRIKGLRIKGKFHAKMASIEFMNIVNLSYFDSHVEALEMNEDQNLIIICYFQKQLPWTPTNQLSWRRHYFLTDIHEINNNYNKYSTVWFSKVWNSQR